MIFNFLKSSRRNYYKKIAVYPYTDLHAHIIPTVDDGSPDMQMSLAMLEAEIAQGVQHLILTPHFRLEENNVHKIKAHYDALIAQVRKNNLPIQLHLGSEIFYDSSTIEKLAEGQVLTMAGTRYVLIEFSPTVSFHYLDHAMDELLMAGYYPILAHAERYQCIADHLNKLEELVNKGVYIQINANSFLSHPKKKQLVSLIDEGLIHFIGTDCHRMDWRPVNLRAACRHLADHIDEEDYCRIFFENPQKLLKNEII